MKRAFQLFDEGIGYLEGMVSVVSLIIITSLVFLQMVLGYVFTTSFPWTEEVVITRIVCMALFGAVRAVRMKEHTEAGGVAKPLPKYAGIALRAAANAVALVTVAIMAYSSFFLAGRTTTVTPVLRYKLYYNCYGIAFGSAPWSLTSRNSQRRIISGTPPGILTRCWRTRKSTWWTL